MKVPSCKKCNICTKVVARKTGLTYRTDESYVTIRSDSVDIFGYGSNTIKGKLHICIECWNKLAKAIQNEVIV